MKGKNKKAEEAQTPIIDGDARPDKNIEPDPSKERQKIKNKDNQRFTSERASDTSSLENYKDEK